LQWQCVSGAVNDDWCEFGRWKRRGCVDRSGWSEWRIRPVATQSTRAPTDQDRPVRLAHNCTSLTRAHRVVAVTKVHRGAQGVIQLPPSCETTTAEQISLAYRPPAHAAVCTTGPCKLHSLEQMMTVQAEGTRILHAERVQMAQRRTVLQQN